MRRTKLLVIAAVVGGSAAALAATGWAFFRASGSAYGGAAVGTMAPPTGVTATVPDPTVRTVHVAWTPPTAPDGNGPSGYTVARSDGSTTSAACGTGTAALAGTAINCDDTSVASGVYTYTVTSQWNSWTATSAASAAVTVAASALHHFTVVPSTSTPTAGTALSLTVSAYDQYGAVMTGYTGSQCVSFSGPGTSPSPASTAPTYPAGGAGCTGGNSLVTFSSGVGTPSVTLFNAQTTTLTVTDVATTKTGAASLTVSAAGIDHFVVSPSTTTPTAGTSFTATLTAHDLYDNVATSYTGAQTVAWSGLGTSPAPTNQAPSYPSSSVTFASGTSTTTLTAFAYASGANTLTATSGGHAGSASLTVAAAAASKLAFGTQPSNATGGATISPSPTVAVQDAYSNVATTNSSSVTIAIGTNPSSGTLSGTTTVAASSGVATFAGLSINKVGTGYTLVATDGSLTSSTSSTFNITVGAAAKLAFTTQPNGGTSSTAWTTQPVVTIQDAGGNTVSSTASITLAVGTNPGSGTLTCTTNPLNATGGTATFAGCKIDKAGTGYTLTASSGSLTSATSSTFNITFGAAAKLAFTTLPGGAHAVNLSPQPVVTVQDAAGNTVTNSSVSVVLAVNTGPGGGNISGTTTVNAVNGVATYTNVQLSKAGAYTLKATSAPLTQAISASFTLT